MVDENIENISACYMSKEAPDNFEKEMAGCPVDMKRMDLEGGCHNCKLCLKGVDIWFKT